MKVVTWNVNSLRAREDLVLDWVEANQPDILCLQETKVTDQEFPEDVFGDLDYDVIYYGQQSYNGVAIAAKEEFFSVIKGFDDDDDTSDRRVIAAKVAGLNIVNIYLPNGKAYESDKYHFKLEWMDKLCKFMDNHFASSQPLILLGDFNLAPRDVDVHGNYPVGEQLFVSKRERDRFQWLLNWGLTDSYLHFDEAPGRFTWWDYRGQGFLKDEGMRIDHILVTEPVLAKAQAVRIDRAARTLPQPSDHAPVLLELAD